MIYVWKSMNESEDTNLGFSDCPQRTESSNTVVATIQKLFNMKASLSLAINMSQRLLYRAIVDCVVICHKLTNSRLLQ